MLGTFRKKNELPEYLSHYGMHRAPFSSSIEDDMYYTDPVRQQRLEVLLHLAQNTDELLLIVGEQGMGKSTFINQFQKNAAEHWKLCFIEGHKMMTEEQLLEQVYTGFNIAHTSAHKGSMLSNLRKRLESMLEDALPVILVVDDAHLFSTKVLSLIIDIASIKNTKTGSAVRVILASEPQIKVTLAEPALDNAHNLIIRKIDLPPLDLKQTGGYLHHRLTQAGMVVEQFLTEPTIRKIFKNSGGIPEKINEAADKLLFDTTPIIRRHSHIESTRKSAGLKTFIILLILIIGAAVAAFFLMQKDEINSQTEQAELPPEATAQKTTPLVLPPPDAGSASNEGPVSETIAEDTVDPMQRLKEELSENTTPEEPPAQIEPDNTKQSQNQLEEADVQSSVAKSQLKDNAWMMQQNPAHFTLQLVAGLKQPTIENFIKKYHLNGELTYFSSMRNGKVWHNLSYGIFPDRQSATNAIKSLPTSVSDQKPWIRQIRSIQSEIKNLDQ